MNVNDFDFTLPDELVAQEPVPRGQSRLLSVSRETGQLRHLAIRNLPDQLTSGDLLVANDTRVFPARLLGQRLPTGGAVECLLLFKEDPSLEPRTSNIEIWHALMHPGQKLKPGARVVFQGAGKAIHGEVLERQFFGRRRIRLLAERGTLTEAIDAIGHIPLPPYIHRPDTPEDHERYQTVFASHRGSVAAPTAGLHFDAALHVGYGTFKPVRAERVEEHAVDPEPYEISPAAATAINTALDEGRRVVAVGTTTTRALEDAVRRGGGRMQPGAAAADIFIHPPFDFRVISGLLTNFHLPKSSLLMLVSAFAGRERVLAAYREAVEQRYRFYSYGDAMLVV